MKKQLQLPDDIVKAKYWSEGFCLTPRKRKFVKGNIELRVGMKYWIWSAFSRCYYHREISSHNDPNKLIDVISHGLVWLAPNEEQRAAIRKEMESYGMGYYQMNRYRMYEYLLDQHTRLGDKSYGYQSKSLELINKLKRIRNEEA